MVVLERLIDIKMDICEPHVRMNPWCIKDKGRFGGGDMWILEPKRMVLGTTIWTPKFIMKWHV